MFAVTRIHVYHLMNNLCNTILRKFIFNDEVLFLGKLIYGVRLQLHAFLNFDIRRV